MRTLPARTTPTTAAAPTPAAPTITRPPTPGRAILDDPDTARVLYATWAADPAVIVPSPPGTGKTRLVVLLAATLAHRADLRVGIAAQARHQALELAPPLGHHTDRARLIWPAKHGRPDSGTTPTVNGPKATYPTDHGGMLIATTARWLYSEPATMACDVMIVDEAWQATYADIGALSAYAEQIVCVGDPGQIAPVVTGNPARWAHNPTGPHLPAPGALRAAHGAHFAVITLRHTWRLGPQTTALIQPALYPDLPFTSRRPAEHPTTTAGRDLPEISHRPITTTPGDQLPITAAADRARELFTTTLTTADGVRPTQAANLAVVCSRVNQAAAVRAHLADHPDVLIGTANQLQGLERPAVVAVHPLAGVRDASAFGTDLGRTCVMLSRHRAHLTVILDTTTADMLGQADDPRAPCQLLITTALSAAPQPDGRGHAAIPLAHRA